MTPDPSPETRRADPERVQKYHCVTQLREDSWEYRIKRAGDEPNCDDLVAWDYLLEVHDRLKTEHDAWDKRRIADMARLRAELASLQFSLSDKDSTLREMGYEHIRVLNDCLQENIALQAKMTAAQALLKDWRERTYEPYVGPDRYVRELKAALASSPATKEPKC